MPKCYTYTVANGLTITVRANKEPEGDILEALADVCRAACTALERGQIRVEGWASEGIGE